MTDYKALKLMRNGCEYCFPGSGGGGGGYCIDYLAVGGGAAGNFARGGSGGAVCYGEGYEVSGPLDIEIGCGGMGWSADAGGCTTYGGMGKPISGCCFINYCLKSNGGDTKISNVVTAAGGNSSISACGSMIGGNSGSGYTSGVSYRAGNGGGGAGGNGCDAANDTLCYGGNGGLGICGFGGGGGGYGCCSGGTGCCGGGNGVRCATCGWLCIKSGIADATNCGGGGGATVNYGGGRGGNGIVCICYPKDGSYGFSGAIGGDCCFEEGDNCVHIFTKNGTFIPNTILKPYIEYLVVGGGGAGGKGYYNLSSGGGGGEVCIGGTILNKNEIDIVVGTGGISDNTSCASCIRNGGASKLGNLVMARGGLGPTACFGGLSGNMNLGGWSTYTCTGAGGGGAGGHGGVGNSICSCGCGYGGNGGVGICGYGGGGGGGMRTVASGYGITGCAVDGGGQGAATATSNGGGATNCGGGGGGSVSCNGGRGGNGVVDICYACDGSRGIHSATGGNSCYLCGNICVHRFTSNGTFTIVS